MRIEILGEPLAQIRMKYSGRGGFGRLYDPRKKQKDELKEFLKNEYGKSSYFCHPYLSFLFLMPIPKGIRKRDKELYNSGLLKHENKPDVDNLLKLYLDCMTGIFFEDDKKVALGSVTKIYHPEPKTIIYIQESKQLLTPSFLHALECEKLKFFENDYLSCSCNSNAPSPLLSHHMLGPDLLTVSSSQDSPAPPRQVLISKAFYTNAPALKKAAI